VADGIANLSIGGLLFRGFYSMFLVLNFETFLKVFESENAM